MYIDEKVATKVCEKLNLSQFPELDSEAYDEMIFKLRNSEDADEANLADEIEGAIIFDNLGDPRHEQLKAEKNERKKAKLTRILFQRDKGKGEFVVSRYKVIGLVLLLSLGGFTAIFFGNRTGSVNAQESNAQESIEETNTDTAEMIDDSINQENDEASVTDQAKVGITVPELNLEGLRLPSVTVNSPSGQQVSSNNESEPRTEEASTNLNEERAAVDNQSNEESRPRPVQASNSSNAEVNTEVVAGEITIQKSERKNESDYLQRVNLQSGGALVTRNNPNTVNQSGLIQGRENTVATNPNLIQRNGIVSSGNIVQRNEGSEQRSGIINSRRGEDQNNIENNIVTTNNSGNEINPTSTVQTNTNDNTIAINSRESAIPNTHTNIASVDRNKSTVNVYQSSDNDNVNGANDNEIGTENEGETSFLPWYASNGYTNEVVDLDEEGNEKVNVEAPNENVENLDTTTTRNTRANDFEEALNRSRNSARNRQEEASKNFDYTTGEIIEGELIFGIMMTEGSNVPILIIDENNAIWSGSASFNNISRVAIELDQYIIDGNSYPITATVLGDDDYPGVPATLQQETPNIAAQMVQATLRGVSDYVDDLAQSTSVSISQTGQVAVEDKTLPLEFAIAGSLTDLFAPPETTKSVVEVVKVEIGQKVKIIILGNGN